MRMEYPMSMNTFVFITVLSIAAAAATNLHDRDHYKDGKHDDNFDHEAMVGSDRAPDYDSLTPEESQQRLVRLVKTKVDADGDGYVTELELRNHIEYMQKRNVRKTVDDAWANFDAKRIKNGLVSWDDYQAIIFGENFDLSKVDPKLVDDYRRALNRNRNRFHAADIDRNGALSKDEYACFVRPEYCDHMRAEVVDETLDEIDKNKDGFIDYNEYRDDMASKANGTEVDADYQQQERQLFHSNWDHNNDEKLDREEIGNWIMPVGIDYAKNEALHLISTADDNKDGRLESGEFINHYDAFVGSQTTDYGKQLQKHDPTEL
jgi:Ca2+-binding EF-hand superfamily protein